MAQPIAIGVDRLVETQKNKDSSNGAKKSSTNSVGGNSQSSSRTPPPPTILPPPWRIRTARFYSNELNQKLVIEEQGKTKSTRELIGTKRSTENLPYFILVPKPDKSISLIPVADVVDFHAIPKTRNSNKSQAFVKLAEEQALRDITEEKLKRKLKRDLKQNAPEPLSAVSVTNLRNHPSAWDFDDGVRSDDEEDGAPSPNDELDEGADMFAPESDAKLTRYGETMKNLLTQNEVSQVKTQPEEPPPENETIDETQQRKTEPIPTCPKSLEVFVLQALRQHGGRMTIPTFMIQFNVREQKSLFRTLQACIQRLCVTTTKEEDGKKVKYIVLKEQYA